MWEQQGLGLSWRAVIELVVIAFFLTVAVVGGVSLVFRLAPPPSTAPTATGRPAPCSDAGEAAAGRQTQP